MQLKYHCQLMFHHVQNHHYIIICTIYKPIAPLGPRSPGSPLGPVIPFGPGSPFSPFLPGGPMGPGIPSLQ